MNNNSRAKLQSQLTELITQAVLPLSFELLEVNVGHSSGGQLVLVRLDRLDEQPVTVDDLTRASRAVEALLDQLDPIQGEYRLEFESPGAKRPLITPRHFERMLGLKAKVRSEAHNFTAPIQAVSGDQVTFQVAGEPLTLTVGTFESHLAEFPDRHR